MARYSAFLGRRVEVQYRAGDILLPASGTFVADSGRSIFLEQQFEQHGNHRQFRWEIPYQYIVRLGEKAEVGQAPRNLAEKNEAAGSSERVSDPQGRAEQSANASDSVAGGASNILPLQNRPKTA